MLTSEHEPAFAEAAEEMAAHVRSGLNREDALDPAELFAHVYTAPTPQLLEQADQLRAESSEETA